MMNRYRDLRKYLISKKPLYPRTINIGKEYSGKFTKNVVRNQKYNIFTFLPLTLFEQFKFFLNLYFLFVALSQFFPSLKIGNLYSYWVPLGFVLGITIIREGYEEFLRYWRDRKLNNEKYQKFDVLGSKLIKSKDIRVGDVLILHKNQRIPADVILLRTSEINGSCFIKTDQLDGETDWKLKHAIPMLQELEKDEDIFHVDCEIFAESPHKDINSFIGTSTRILNNQKIENPLSIENVLWASTTLTAGTILVLVIYTGKETRSELNRSKPQYKVGLLDKEVDFLTFLLFIFLACLTIGSMFVRGFQYDWPNKLVRFALIYSYIIPISLKVNMELAKLYHSFFIGRDKTMPNIQVRTSSIPEELGRISYLLTDKTGTLTKNEMKFKKLHIGSISLSEDAFEEVKKVVEKKEMKSPIEIKISKAVESIALCHNVTPLQESNSKIYQASSPDEIALVEWAESVGVSLTARDTRSMTLSSDGKTHEFEILHIFPFTPDRKRMGIITKNLTTGEILFNNKGADSVISKMVGYNDWLEEECTNMAREGLRTMVFAKKSLTQQELNEFNQKLHSAKMSTVDRGKNIEETIKSIEFNMSLICVTGVEDKLQDNVRASIESLIQAGIKICMLTGDKQETALSIAKSCGIFKKTSQIILINAGIMKEETLEELEKAKEKTYRTSDSVLLLSGETLEVCLQFEEKIFGEIFDLCETTVVYRCSPDQKAKIALLLKKKHPQRRIAAIGDGGNDVTMIQEAHIGIGIESKDGKQASLAADFSVTDFSNICPLFMVHGRNAYKQTSILAQYVMHRGIIIAVIQAIYTFLNRMRTTQVFDNFLMVNYTTIYTPLAALAILTDHDTSRKASLTYSELYKELRRGRSLTLKTFFIWVLISIYQGGFLYYGFYFFGDLVYSHFVTVVFSALVLTELLTILSFVQKLTFAMVIGELQCLLALVGSLFLLTSFFDRDYVLSWRYPVLTFGLTLAATGPLFIFKFFAYHFARPTAAKVK
ncbi:hypothetical protein FO519_004046 [Halicephalobus sp. NKZ332]|nr:hypothetical protein FO519_004046 [Halicephalobus sp. NKZ332]